MSSYERITNILCAIGKTVLWPYVIKQSAPRHQQLLIRPSRGTNSYHRPGGRPNQHEIFIGKKAVISLLNTETARRSQAAKEIMEYGYFDGVPSPSRLLTHHLVCVVARGLQSTRENSTGNKHDFNYYSTLAELYEKGLADHALHHLIITCREKRIALTFYDTHTTVLPGFADPLPTTNTEPLDLRENSSNKHVDFDVLRKVIGTPSIR